SRSTTIGRDLSGMGDIRSGRYCLDQRVRRGQNGRMHSGDAESGTTAQLFVLGAGAFLAAHVDEHADIGEVGGRVGGVDHIGQYGFHDQQAAVGGHRLVILFQDDVAAHVVPVVQDVLENVAMSALEYHGEEVTGPDPAA